jgi:hypothetical protein
VACKVWLEHVESISRRLADLVSAIGDMPFGITCSDPYYHRLDLLPSFL